MAQRGRPKGSKNKTSSKKKSSDKIFPFRPDIDLLEWVESRPCRNRYFNDLIRKDYEEYIKQQTETTE